MLLCDYVDTSNGFDPLAQNLSYDDLKKNFRLKVPEHFNFATDVVDKYARLEPERSALVWCNDYDEDRNFNFKQLSEGSAQLAHFLSNEGIRKGDAVMLILRRRWEFWYFILALHRIGAIAVPATNMLLAQDIAYRNNTASVKALVTLDDEKLQEEVEKARPESPTVKTYITVGKRRQGWLRCDCNNLTDARDRPYPTSFTAPEQINNSDIMLLYFTSGTSGEPKMVQHNFTYPLGHIVTAKYWHNCSDGGLHLTVAETGWAKAMWGKIYGQWLAGSSVFVYDMLSFVPGCLMDKMTEHHVTTFCAPPTVYRYLTRLDFNKYDLSSLVYCTTAGEAMEPEIAAKWKKLTGMTIHDGYGQTELTLTTGNFVGMEARSGSMGKPAPGYDVDVVNQAGQSCQAKEPGEVVLRLDKGHPFGMFAGYYHDETLTKAAFAGNLYHTGDLAMKDEDGYLWFLGRMDDMIKSSGYRISPFEVESALVKYPAVIECAVTGVEDPKRGQVVKASIVLAPGYDPSPALAREIQDFVRKTTAAYKYPRVIEFVDELPKTISGKIRRAAIRTLDRIAAIRTQERMGNGMAGFKHVLEEAKAAAL